MTTSKAPRNIAQTSHANCWQSLSMTTEEFETSIAKDVLAVSPTLLRKGLYVKIKPQTNFIFAPPCRWHLGLYRLSNT